MVSTPPIFAGQENSQNAQSVTESIAFSKAKDPNCWFAMNFGVVWEAQIKDPCWLVPNLLNTQLRLLFKRMFRPHFIESKAAARDSQSLRIARSCLSGRAAKMINSRCASQLLLSGFREMISDE